VKTLCSPVLDVYKKLMALSVANLRSSAQDLDEQFDDLLRSSDTAFDPFRRPSTVTRIADTWPRQHVAIEGVVTAVEVTGWAGCKVLEAALDDCTGFVLLAFFGRSEVAGIGVGRALTAAGTLVTRRGTCALLNPYVWLQAPLTRSQG
jgi:hypothetical protein